MSSVFPSSLFFLLLLLLLLPSSYQQARFHLRLQPAVRSSAHVV